VLAGSNRAADQLLEGVSGSVPVLTSGTLTSGVVTHLPTLPNTAALPQDAGRRGTRPTANTIVQSRYDGTSTHARSAERRDRKSGG
jgi:hypothetical protein